MSRCFRAPYPIGSRRPVRRRQYRSGLELNGLTAERRSLTRDSTPPELSVSATSCAEAVTYVLPKQGKRADFSFSKRTKSLFFLVGRSGLEPETR
jgi:hypothetical protein